MLVLHKIDRNLTAVAILELTQQDTRNRQMRRNCRQLACVGGRYKQALRRTLQATRRGGHLKKKNEGAAQSWKRGSHSFARTTAKEGSSRLLAARKKERKEKRQRNERNTHETACSCGHYERTALFVLSSSPAREFYLCPSGGKLCTKYFDLKKKNSPLRCTTKKKKTFTSTTTTVPGMYALPYE